MISSGGIESSFIKLATARQVVGQNTSSHKAAAVQRNGQWNERTVQRNTGQGAPIIGWSSGCGRAEVISYQRRERTLPATDGTTQVAAYLLIPVHLWCTVIDSDPQQLYQRICNCTDGIEELESARKASNCKKPRLVEKLGTPCFIWLSFIFGCRLVDPQSFQNAVWYQCLRGAQGCVQ